MHYNNKIQFNHNIFFVLRIPSVTMRIRGTAFESRCGKYSSERLNGFRVERLRSIKLIQNHFPLPLSSPWPELRKNWRCQNFCITRLPIPVSICPSNFIEIWKRFSGRMQIPEDVFDGPNILETSFFCPS